MSSLSPVLEEQLSRLRKRDPKVEVRFDGKSQALASARGKLSDQFDAKVLKENPFHAGKEFLKTNKQLFGNLDVDKDLAEDKKVVDRAGMVHVSFRQRYANVPVFDRSVRVDFSTTGTVSSAASKLAPGLKLDVAPKLSASDAEKAALGHAGEGAVTIAKAKPELLIFPHGEGYRLSWRVALDAHKQKDPAEWIYFIDAVNGEVLFRYNDLRNAGPTTGKGTGYYSGTHNDLHTYEVNSTDYELKDMTREPAGPEIDTSDVGPGGASPSEDANDNWNDQTTTPRYKNQGPEVDTNVYVGKVVDWYLTTFGRRSYDNNGTTVKSDVHYLTNLNNAYWSNQYQKIFVGDGDGVTFDYVCSDDVIGHEFTHAVTHHCFNPVYAGESGALDEAISDCMAAFFSGDWLIGEDLFTRLPNPPVHQFLRNLADPTNGGQYNPADPVNSCLAGNCPDHYDDLYTGTLDNGGVHINCTIVSHAIYLMVNGGTHRKSGVTVTKIGQTPVETMLYHVQTTQLLGNNNPTFLDFREGFLNACLDLYPDDLQALATVKAAFKAVGVGPDLYLREAVWDVGNEPAIGFTCESLDIIARQTPPANPQVELGDPQRSDLCQNIEYGKDNYIFVRISNCGHDASDAQVDVYGVPAGTSFGDPVHWQYIGNVLELNVKPGEFRVSKPIVFAKSAIPKPPVGQELMFCFVGIVHSPLDPAPDHTRIHDWSSFANFVLMSNNYAWKNDYVVNVVYLAPIKLYFQVRNLPHLQTWPTLEIDLRNLPEATQFHISFPEGSVRGADLSETMGIPLRQLSQAELIERLQGLQPFDMRRRLPVGEGRIQFAVTPGRIGTLRRMMLSPGESVEAEATITLPRDIKGGQFRFAVRQIVNNMPVGQMNYTLRCKER